uniref:Uncharacterized protein LOC104238914 n=1 Tax=Nicotiana sylvestris TaxID=4096 RepID=A0A1U7XLF7_NICSY|nr:PREDICTED: uncharacterized protein LOC104238914 [Nicotiana sylvestris]
MMQVEQRQNAINSSVVEVSKGELVPRSSTLTILFSSSQVENIIKQAQAEMVMNTTLVKQPMVTLNTSVFNVPSQSVESSGELKGESGQLVLSTGNNNEVIQQKVKEMAINSKLWREQREEEDEEDWGDGFAGYSSEEGEQEVDQESAGEEIDPTVKPKPHEATTSSPTTKLNIHAPIFIPRNSPTAVMPDAAAGRLVSAA